MSEQNLKAFLSALAADPSMNAALRAAAGVGAEDKVPVEALIRFAASKGFAIEADDLMATERELSDADLEEVAGGVGYLRLGGVSGETKDSSHGKWIDVLSLNTGVSKPGGG
ncbi:MAG: Nif11-like leader peptide family natural product precursor [Chromatiales bacterium]|nr:Nif11-like leader peptide family natural product precursor [Chromatiales bacterium]